MAEKNPEFEYVAALQDFSKSLKYFVASIKAQVENENAMFKDSVASAKEQAKNMVDMAQKLEVVAEASSAAKSNTEQILDIVKGIKQEKKSGIWDKLSGAKDKTKSMADGIKTIALMAGAILAVGTAFKIVGEVDFKSVLALAVALPLVAEAFNTVGETTHDPKEAALIAFSMIIMSVGITASGAIMSMMPSLTFGQMISIVAVSVAMSAAMFGLSYAADKLGMGEILGLAGIALTLPVIAWGITMAGMALQSMPELGMKQVLSAGAVGIALGLSLIPLAYAADKIGMKKVGSMYAIAPVLPIMAAAIMLAGLELTHMPEVGMKQVLGAGAVGLALGISIIPLAFAAKLVDGKVASMYGLTVMMPILAAAIYASALILQHVPEINMMNTIKASLGITAAAVIFGAGIWVFDKLGLNIGTVLKGSLAMVAVAGGIMASSLLLAMGDYSNAPSFEWSLHAGAALLGGGLIAAGMGLVISMIIPGVVGMLAVAGGIAAASQLMALGNYTNAPSLEWSKGAGLALGGFGLAAVALGAVMLTGVGALALAAGIVAMAGVAAGLVTIAGIVGKGTYTGGPSVEWATGVGLALKAFTDAVSSISPDGWDLIGGTSMEDKIAAVIKIGAALPELGNMISKGTYSNGPTKEWVNGLMYFMSSFAKLEMVDDAADASKQIMMLASSYTKLAASISIMGKALGSIKSAPDLTGIYGGLVTLSLIDSDNLEDTLSTLNDKKDEFQSVLSMIQAQSSVKIDESTFAFNKDKSEAKGGASKAAPASVKAAAPSAAAVAKVQPKPAATNPSADKQEKLLNQLVALMGQMNGVLGEIADNTAHKMSGDIIGN